MFPRPFRYSSREKIPKDETCQEDDDYLNQIEISPSVDGPRNGRNINQNQIIP